MRFNFSHSVFSTHRQRQLLKLSGLLIGAFCIGQSLSAKEESPSPAPIVINQGLPTIPLTAGIHVIQTELAQTPEQRSIGLMGRTSLANHRGMLFVFEQSSIQCFWMKNTLIPLSVAFVDQRGVVTQINDMEPLSLEQHCSKQEVPFVLEMNKGWFKKNGIRPGDRLTGAPFQAQNNRH